MHHHQEVSKITRGFYTHTHIHPSVGGARGRRRDTQPLPPSPFFMRHIIPHHIAVITLHHSSYDNNSIIICASQPAAEAPHHHRRVRFLTRPPPPPYEMLGGWLSKRRCVRDEIVTRRHRPAACHSRGTTGAGAPLPRPSRIPDLNVTPGPPPRRARVATTCNYKRFSPTNPNPHQSGRGGPPGSTI